MKTPLSIYMYVYIYICMYVCTCVFKYQCPKVKIQSSAAFQANEPAKDDVPEQLETKAVFGAQNM